jgi:hypothetical protein
MGEEEERERGSSRAMDSSRVSMNAVVFVQV